MQRRDPPPAPSSDRSTTRNVGAISAAAATAVGALGLVGWTWGELPFLRITSDSRAIQPLSALALTMGGAGVLAGYRALKSALVVAGVITTLLGLVALLGSAYPAAARSLELDRYAPGAVAANWPSIPVSLALTAAGLAILFRFARYGPVHRSGILVASAGLVFSLLSLAAFLTLLAAPLEGVRADLLFPLHTSVGLVAVFGGILSVGSRRTWLETVFAREWRGRIARILLASALVPMLLAWVAEQGQRTGLYSPDARVLVVVLGAALMLTVLALLAASLLGDERQDRDELARALDLSPNLLRDADGKILYWSRGCEDLYGWSAEEAVGRHCDELLGACAPGLEALNEAADDREAVWQSEAEHRTSNGDLIPVLLRVVLHERKGGRPPVALLSISDLTEQRRAHEALLERDARLLQMQGELFEASRLNSMGEMAASLAHELNQPLTAAANFLGAAEIGLRKLDAPMAAVKRQAIEHALRRSVDEMLRAGEIVRRLRDFIARGDVDIGRESLSEIIPDALELGLTSAPAGAIDVRWHIDAEAEWVLADRVQIQQVIVNLVRNAAEAMLAEDTLDKTLRVVARRVSPSWVNVSISDNGPGLPEAIAQSAFTAFTSEKATGMGVGLSISKRIVEAHGGSITLADTSACGTTFEFTVPAFEPQEE